MKRLLAIAALGEAATGIVLFVLPSLVVSLLFGADIEGAGIVMSRVAGVALLALGIASWPGANCPLAGMLTYSVVVTVYFVVVGLRGQWVGSLLWPAVGAHAVLTALLARNLWCKWERHKG